MQLDIKLIKDILDEYIDRDRLSNEDLIRIEKRILLQSKLQSDFTRDSVVAVVDLFRSSFSELKIIAKHIGLFDFLENKAVQKWNSVDFIPSQSEKLENCFESYFQVSLKGKIEILFKNQDYKTLGFMISVAKILPIDLIYLIQELIEKKLNIAFVYLSKDVRLEYKSSTMGYFYNYFFKEIELNKKSEALVPIYNDDFYKLVNAFFDYSFDDYITDITNITVDKLNENRYPTNAKIYLWTLFHLHKYKANSLSLQATIKQNYEFAEEKIRTFKMKAQNLYKNKFVLILCLIWIIGFCLADSNSQKTDDLTLDKYRSYNGKSNNTKDFFFNLDLLAVNYEYLDSNPIFKENIDREMNAKFENLYIKDSFLKVASNNNFIPIQVENSTSKDAYLFTDRVYGNSLIKIPAMSTEIIYFIKYEHFKVYMSAPSNNYKLYLDGFKFKEAKALSKTFLIQDTLAISYFKISRKFNVYPTIFSDNIKELD